MSHIVISHRCFRRVGIGGWSTIDTNLVTDTHGGLSTGTAR